MTETTQIPYQCTISEAALEKAKRELKEDPATRQQKLDELRDLFKTRPDIKFRRDDAFLLRFLRNKKFDVGRTLKMMVHYYEVRRDYKDIFGDYRPSAVKHFYGMGQDFICPGRDKDGRVVLVSRTSMLDLDKYSILDGVKTQLTLIETMLSDEDVQVNGMVYILDTARLSANDLKHSGPATFKKATDVYLNAMPIRLKEIHFVRQPGIFQAMYTVLKPFLTEKIKNRIHLHGDEYGTLHEYVPSAMLPTELGGQIPGFDNKEWIHKALAAENEFVYNNQFGFLKSADILGKQETTADPTTGLTGTFKKLHVD